MSAITLLHLSDIHFKKDNDGNYPPFPGKVNEWMVEGISRHLIEISDNLDYVVVTGDIAFSGKQEEYETAKKFFDSLTQVLPKQTEFLIVPGNHDVDRRKIDEAIKMHDIVSNGKSDIFLKDETKLSVFVHPKFKAFYKFAGGIQPGLFGDCTNYFWVKDNLEKNVSFLGLNSCWASEENNENMKIALGLRQLNEAIERSKTSNRIILLHHPLDNWLQLKDTSECKKEIFKYCKLVLHGHSHFDSALVNADPDNSIVQLGANASYTEGKGGFIGFQFIHIDNNENFSVRVWPYKLQDQRNAFAPDTARYDSQGGKPYFDIRPFNASKRGTKKSVKPLIIPDEYREWLDDFHSTLPIEQLAKKGEAFTVPLPRVYIPLETANPFHKEEIKKLQAEKEKRERIEGEDVSDDELEPKEPSVIDIEALLGRQDTVLLRGEPGMGKTTLVRHLAYMVVHGQAKPGLQGYLPVLVFLKDLWPLFEKELNARNDGIKFEAMLGPYFNKIDCPLGADIVKDYIKQGRAILLIDGLDEVPDHLRGPLVEKIARFRSKNKGNRFLLTGRPHGINGLVMERFGKFLQDIEPLDHQKIADFITDWFREVCGKAKGIAEKTSVELIGDISTNEYVSVFVQNPLLLTAVCILYQDNKKLPDQRADLYGRVVDNLLCKRFSDPADPDNVPRLEAFLMRLAFVMQEKHLKHMEPYGAKELLKQFYPKKDKEENSEYNCRIGRLFDDIEPNCGLLKRQSGGDVEFFHLTFQEFMAARYMIDKNLDFKKYLPDPWWDETILLYAGLVSLDRTDEGNQIVETILNFNGEHKSQHHRFCLLGSNALRDMLTFKRSADVIELSRENLKGVIVSHEDPKIRLKAGEILGVFGDDRYKDFEMVEVLAGEFIRGSDDGGPWGREAPSRKIYLDAFLIGKYPVTNREFKEFVDSRVYEHEKYWNPKGWGHIRKENITGPLYWRDQNWNGANFPVVGVNWYECEAFCRWLSEKTGLNYRLPTEAEWEKASRGTDGRLWPWGNEFDSKLCNSGELNLARTSPIGIFCGSESPYGCVDMSGNVWEWCQDWYDRDYYENSQDYNPPGAASGYVHVVRGGGWGDVGDRCRCAFRGRGVPTHRVEGGGFRLARSL